MAEKNKDMQKVNAQPVARRDADEVTYRPLVDVYEAEDGAAVVVADIPGAKREDVDITVERGLLRISAGAKVNDPGEGYAPAWRSFSSGRYQREFSISDEFDRDRIEATVADGVLTVRLPRAAHARTKKITVGGR